MGGLIVRETLQVAYKPGEAAEAVNKVVTLGTPHKGIAFQRMKSLKWLPFLEAGPEIERFNPERQADSKNPAGYKNLAKAFPLDRLLVRRRDELPGLQRRAGDVPEQAVLDRGRVRDELQPKRRPREDRQRVRARRAARVRLQVPRRRGLADHLTRGVRDRHPLLPR